MKDKLVEMGMPLTHDDINYIEHRVYHDYVGSVEYENAMGDPKPSDFPGQQNPKKSSF